jgi:hypothetical protein
MFLLQVWQWEATQAEHTEVMLKNGEKESMFVVKEIERENLSRQVNMLPGIASGVKK